MFRITKLAFLIFAAALAFAQSTELKTDQRDEQIALLKAKLALYQRGLFACQDAQIEARAWQQVKPPRIEPPKPKPDNK